MFFSHRYGFETSRLEYFFENQSFLVFCMLLYVSIHTRPTTSLIHFELSWLGKNKNSITGKYRKLNASYSCIANIRFQY